MEEGKGGLFVSTEADVSASERFLFIGGPLDGEWHRAPRYKTALKIQIPIALSLETRRDDEALTEKRTFNSVAYFKLPLSGGDRLFYVFRFEQLPLEELMGLLIAHYKGSK